MGGVTGAWKLLDEGTAGCGDTQLTAQLTVQLTVQLKQRRAEIMGDCRFPERTSKEGRRRV